MEHITEVNVWLTSAALATLTVLLVHFLLRQQRLPPGPRGLPVLGYWPFLDPESSHLQLERLQREHGEVFSFNVLGHLFVNLGSFRAIREVKVLKADCFQDRITCFSLMQELFKGGFSFVNGEQWKTLRSFFVKSLESLGLPLKTRSSGQVYANIEALVAKLQEAEGGPVDFIELISDTFNIVWFHAMFGESILSEEVMQQIRSLYHPIGDYITSFSAVNVGRIAKYFLVPFKFDYHKAVKAKDTLMSLLHKILQDQKATHDENNVSNIIDAFIKEKRERIAKNDETARHFTDEALCASLMQMIGDSLDTVGLFLALNVLALAEHQDEQTRVRDEVADVVGPQRLPTLDDKSRLPRTNAFLLEVVRTTDFFPYSPNLQCTKETTIGGFTIPKGSIMVMNQWCANHDPAVYEDPNKFNPSRWLTEDKSKRPEMPLLFGIGKRSCPGEEAIKQQAFLLVSSLVHEFHIQLHTQLPEQQLQKQNKLDLLLEGQIQLCAKSRRDA